MTPAQAEQHAKELRELWDKQVPTKEEVRRWIGRDLIDAERKQDSNAS